MQKNIKRVITIVLLILIIPILGNIFLDGWNWGILDFVVAFILLFITGIAIDFSSRKIKKTIYKFLAIIGIILVFLAIWTELAVDAVSRLLQD